MRNLICKRTGNIYEQQAFLTNSLFYADVRRTLEKWLECCPVAALSFDQTCQNNPLQSAPSKEHPNL